ncbi:GMP reductase [Apilactobacillus micheneri]|uniref:GMP reductase n=1 Tax=Apilactobacillus micheneri TaxID=1899430 RepID=A0A9Q8INC6_9LACO|nr:GMP reductase [Apilactobacillus micheneri]TPR41094.1 GMP reductase [Apilactobacillus micheneri]TPR45642.1 GMP reductase [Apilactobacillus micheneri]TPR46201.1 GMP reductase [Apilactobacillus micheneri]TPR46886.1 GMP reductase [Apilactobacillus micheneri]TPR49089.1 GMP reductase [Apilactobacillus micheneri]
MQTFDYNNVQLLPEKCIIKSRKEANTTIKFGPHTFKLPVVPANMQTVIDKNLATWLASNDYFYVMHRFQPAERLDFVKRMHRKKLFASISVGIKDSEYKFIDELKDAKESPEYITIDVAHGHSDFVIKMIHYIKDNLPETFLIVGNLGTPDAVREIERAGADATKIGIGPGKACITKYKTGFGTGGWQLSALKWCSKVATKPMIADGGIRTNGDLAKSIKFGASMIMIGSMFAGHLESPGEIVEKDGKKFKQYWGSASAKQKGARHNVEGRQLLIPYRGKINDTLTEMQEDLQSAISYAGGKDLMALRKVNYVLVDSID